MVEVIDTPLTRLKKKHDAEMKKKDQEILELRRELSSVSGVSDMLRLELIEMEITIRDMLEHVIVLKNGLPPETKEPRK